MTRTSVCAAAFALAALALAATPPASAQTSHRAWVSGRGVDQTGCGAPTAPCRSLQYAHDHIVAAGGEIDVLDPGGYGAVVITKAISIVNDGVGTAGVQASSGNAIAISAGVNDAVYLKGLNIDGQGSALHGVIINSVGALTIDNCVIQHFYDGFISAPGAGPVRVDILNTNISNNSNNGIEFDVDNAATSAVLDHDVSNGNATAFLIVEFTPGAPPSTIAITDLLASHNTDAIFLSAVAIGLNVHVDQSKLTENAGEGLGIAGVPLVRFTRNLIYGNHVGVDGPNSQPIYSGGDNHIDANGTDISATTNLGAALPR